MNTKELVEAQEECNGTLILFEDDRLIVLTPSPYKALHHEIRRFSFGCFDMATLRDIRKLVIKRAIGSVVRT